MITRNCVAIAALVAFGVTPIAAQEPAAPASSADHVAAIKQSLGKSAAALRQYQWVETTVVSMKGEEKARTQNSCAYGAEGKVQKTPMAAPAEEKSKSPRGVRGKIAGNKKEEISEDMQEAIALVKQYVPPDPARIQAAKDAGKLTVAPPDPQGHARVTIKDYVKAGDSMTIDLNVAADRIAGVTVSTFTEKAKDAVGLNVAFGAFPDGTVYASNIKLDVAAQNMTVAIDNGNYKKAGG